MSEGGTATAAMRVFFFFALALAVAVAAAGTASATDSLCYVPGCDCNGPDVVCNCVENQVRRPCLSSPGEKVVKLGHIGN